MFYYHLILLVKAALNKSTSFQQSNGFSALILKQETNLSSTALHCLSNFGSITLTCLCTRSSTFLFATMTLCCSYKSLRNSTSCRMVLSFSWTIVSINSCEGGRGCNLFWRSGESWKMNILIIIFYWYWDWVCYDCWFRLCFKKPNHTLWILWSSTRLHL